MKKKNTIQSAIDESLSGVRFNAHDTRSVMNAVRSQEREEARPAKARRLRLFDLAVSMAAVALAVVPVTLFAIRAQGGGSHLASRGLPTPRPDVVTYITPEPAKEDPVILPTAAPTAVPAPSAVKLSEDEAVRIARACFEANCDTSVFTFEEYTVTADCSEAAQTCTVVMKSIYDNGCSFTVVVSCEDGSVLSHSDAAHATAPAHVNMDSAEVQSWFDKNGEDFLAWPQDQQAEFRRRYEGVPNRE